MRQRAAQDSGQCGASRELGAGIAHDLRVPFLQCERVLLHAGHLHLVVIGESVSASLPRFMQAFKSLAVRETGRLGIAKPWQKGFYDHVLGDGESIDSAALYAFLNPVRAGLVRRVEEWPYSGSFVFAWPNVPVVSTVFVPSWKKEAQAEVKKSKIAR